MEVFMKISRLFVFVFLVISLFLFTACKADTNSNDEPDVVLPFTEITWEHGFEDVTNLEGDYVSSYDSVYNGTTYTFPKEYLNLDGSIKYMFDGDGGLMCVAWTYRSDSLDTLTYLYNEIHSNLEATYGESGYNANNSTNFGDVWRLSGGHIILSVMNTNTMKALQYSYLNPIVSDDTQPE